MSIRCFSFESVPNRSICCDPRFHMDETVIGIPASFFCHPLEGGDLVDIKTRFPPPRE
ncbi:MAG: hypothetical protein SFT93_01065 [Rickettsiaceae bacterium]|nr:hypothetical protein [Rickettsiaceae bacterium]